MNGLNNARVSEAEHRAQEQVMKSLAAGTATLDAFLARAYLGFELQNFFTFGRGELWTSHASGIPAARPIRHGRRFRSSIAKRPVACCAPRH